MVYNLHPNSGPNVLSKVNKELMWSCAFVKSTTANSCDYRHLDAPWPSLHSRVCQLVLRRSEASRGNFELRCNHFWLQLGYYNRSNLGVAFRNAPMSSNRGFRDINFESYTKWQLRYQNHMDVDGPGAY